MLGVDQGQDGVGPVARGDFRIEEEGLGRARIGEARRLDHHLIERDFPGPAALCEVRQRHAQVIADAATQAPVAELYDLFVAARDNDLAVNVLLTELVLDDRNLAAMGLGEHASQ